MSQVQIDLGGLGLGPRKTWQPSRKWKCVGKSCLEKRVGLVWGAVILSVTHLIGKH